MTRVPEVEQHISRAGVETANRAVLGQIGHIGDPADVDDGTMGAAAEQRRVECGHERRAFAAGRRRRGS
jgi:hypothetical protein